MSLFTELKRRNVIRVAIAYIAGAWLLTEVSGTLFPVFGIPDWGVRFVVIVLALGFLPALIISWAYELTPEGLKREKDVVRDASITHLTAKRLDGITIGLIVVALAFILADRMWLSPRLVVQPAPTTEVVPDNALASEPEPQYPPNSIAVLPFVNMSSDPEQEYFSDGISEELLNLLAKIPELRVISRSSSFTFKGEKVDIPTVATKLNVALVLEGSVQKAGNHVRITAQLIEARSDSHLWSETYTRELKNVFAVQDEISAAIIVALKERLGLGIEAAPLGMAAANTEAHDAYLRGRHLVIQRTRTTLEGAVRELEKAIALDPDYALAHAELAMAFLLSMDYGDLTDTEAIARAIPHVNRSFALDPNLAQAHAARGLLFNIQSEYEEALTHYERAIQISPNYSRVHRWMALNLYSLGRYEEAITMQESALRLDPLSTVAIDNYVGSLIRQNRLDDARREMEKLASIDPAWYANARGILTAVGGKWANLMLGNLDALQINPEFIRKDYLPLELALMGLEREALSVFEIIPPWILHVLGRPKDAVLWAEKRVAEVPADVRRRRYLGLALAAAGDYVHARPLLEEMWQRCGGQVTRWGLMQIDDAAALIAIRRDAGEEIGVDEILAAIKDNVRHYREAGITNGTWVSADYEEGVAAYLTGEREQGLVLIAKAADGGFFILPNEAYLQTLYDDPGFAPIIARQESRQARERNRFLSIVCTNNPYADVWQPAEGTCERFAAEQKN